MFLNKKGDASTESIWWFVDLLILLLVFYFILSAIGEVGENTLFQKKFLAKDMALLIDTLYAAPGNIYIDYPQNTLWFSARFSENKVEVFENQRKLINPIGEGSFLEDRNVRFVYKEFIPKTEYTDKKTLFQKYLPVFELLKRRKYDLEKSQTLNLTFLKTYNELIVANDGKFSNMNALKCPWKDNLNKEPLLVVDQKDALFYIELLPFFKDSAEIIYLDDISDGTYTDNVIIIFTFNKTANSSYIRSYFDAESSALTALSCNIVNEILSNAFNARAETVSVPLNKITINQRAGFDGAEYSNILLLELGKTESFTVDDYKNIRKALYFSLHNQED